MQDVDEIDDMHDGTANDGQVKRKGFGEFFLANKLGSTRGWFFQTHWMVRSAQLFGSQTHPQVLESSIFFGDQSPPPSAQVWQAGMISQQPGEHRLSLCEARHWVWADGINLGISDSRWDSEYKTHHSWRPKKKQRWPICTCFLPGALFTHLVGSERSGPSNSLLQLMQDHLPLAIV